MNPSLDNESSVATRASLVDFIAPLVGHCTCYVDLAEKIKGVMKTRFWEQSEYANGCSASVEAIASRYVDKVENSPVNVIVGYSFGGWVAVEAARQLRARGADPKVVVIDAMVWGRRLPAATIRQISVEMFWANYVNLPPPAEYDDLKAQTGCPLVSIAMQLAALLAGQMSFEEIATALEMIETNLWALNFYVPNAYDGPGVYYRSMERTEGGFDARPLSEEELRLLLPGSSIADCNATHRSIFSKENLDKMCQDIERLALLD